MEEQDSQEKFDISDVEIKDPFIKKLIDFKYKIVDPLENIRKNRKKAFWESFTGKNVRAHKAPLRQRKV